MAGVTGLHCLSDPWPPRDPCRHYSFLVCCIPSPVIGTLPNFTGLHFWARGYCVSTVGLDEAVIRQYIRNQEEQEKRAEQLALGDFAPRREGKHTHGAAPDSPSAPCGGLLQQCPRRGPPVTAPPAGACY